MRVKDFLEPLAASRGGAEDSRSRERLTSGGPFFPAFLNHQPQPDHQDNHPLHDGHKDAVCVRRLAELRVASRLTHYTPPLGLVAPVTKPVGPFGLPSLNHTVNQRETDQNSSVTTHVMTKIVRPAFNVPTVVPFLA